MHIRTYVHIWLVLEQVQQYKVADKCEITCIKDIIIFSIYITNALPHQVHHRNCKVVEVQT